MLPAGVAPPVVVSVVVFLLLLAALCGVLAIWTIVNELRASGSVAPPEPPRLVSPPTVPTRRLVVPPGVPRLPPLLPRGVVHATPVPDSRDDDDDGDYTEVDDGVTIIRDLRVAARR
jgi:hypothetical protein